MYKTVQKVNGNPPKLLYYSPCRPTHSSSSYSTHQPILFLSKLKNPHLNIPAIDKNERRFNLSEVFMSKF